MGGPLVCWLPGIAQCIGCWPTGVWGWVLGPLVGKCGSWVTGDSEAPMANDLLVSEAVSLPGQLLGLGCARISANRLVRGLGHSANNLEGGFQTGPCQQQSAHGPTSTLNGCCQHLCPQGELQLFPASAGDSPDQQVGLTEAPFKSLLLPWVPEHVRFWVHPFRVESQFLTAPGSPERKPCWPSKPNVPRDYLPSSGPQARKSSVLRLLASCGESLQL